MGLTVGQKLPCQFGLKKKKKHLLKSVVVWLWDLFRSARRILLSASCYIFQSCQFTSVDTGFIVICCI